MTRKVMIKMRLALALSLGLGLLAMGLGPNRAKAEGDLFVPAATVWQQFRRYLRLYGAVARYCLARDLEYRTNMVFNLFREGFYAGLQVMFVNLIYLNV